ncbi:MAG TPA: hypothetical protein VFC90_08910 [Planctomycetota bacterium]|nr:hypothetical protein [Planctomycetota bacterium]
MVDASRRRRTDRLFGQIAVELGILTPEKLEEALRVQAESGTSPPLGLVLMDLRLVTREDLEKILEAQQKIADRHRERGREQRDDGLFGKVAVSLRFVTQDQLNECLEMQKRGGPEANLRLGDLMMRRGLVGPDQVRRVMEVQAGLAVPCPRCATLHNVVMFMAGATFPCRKCSLMIAVPVR